MADPDGSESDEGGCCCWPCWDTRHAREPPPSPSHQPLLRLRWRRRLSREEEADAADSPVEAEAALRFEIGGATYLLDEMIGKGAHCLVWRCTLQRSGGRRDSHARAVALKHGRSEGSDMLREARALRALEEHSTAPHRAHLLPRLLGEVTLEGRHCIAMPVLGPDLYAISRARRSARAGPPPYGFVWAVGTQLLAALTRLDECGLMHTDVKPQNICLADTTSATAAESYADADCELSARTRLTLIDLGSSVPTGRLGPAAYVQSRWYRAPEVLLRSPPLTGVIDVWSAGCVIAEVVLGCPLLPGESEANQYARIVNMLGEPPASVLRAARRPPASLATESDPLPIVPYFDHDDLPRLVREARHDQCARGMGTRRDERGEGEDGGGDDDDDGSGDDGSDDGGECGDGGRLDDLISLLLGLLSVDPAQRWSAAKASEYVHACAPVEDGMSVAPCRCAASDASRVDHARRPRAGARRGHGGVVAASNGHPRSGSGKARPFRVARACRGAARRNGGSELRFGADPGDGPESYSSY